MSTSRKWYLAFEFDNAAAMRRFHADLINHGIISDDDEFQDVVDLNVDAFHAQEHPIALIEMGDYGEEDA